MAEHNITGSGGEELAAEYLQQSSYTITERNWRYRRLEVDIIARKGTLLVMAEVKTRHEGFLQPPEMAVDRRKQQLLIKAANAYLVQNKTDLEVRFDIITVVKDRQGGHRIDHIENAFSHSL